MAENGVPIIGANKDRVPGWNLFRQYLKDGKLVFFSTCTNAIRTIPSLVHDESKVEDVLKCNDDHAADAIRMGLMSLPPLPEVEKDAPKNIYKTDPDAPWNKGKKAADYNNLYSY